MITMREWYNHYDRRRKHLESQADERQLSVSEEALLAHALMTMSQLESQFLTTEDIDKENDGK